MKKQTTSKQDLKKGIGFPVIILTIIAVIIAILCIKITSPNSNNKETPNNKDTESLLIPPSDDQDNDTFYDGTFVLPEYNPSYGECLYVDAERIKFPSGGYVIYGYPYLVLENQSICEFINSKLKILVDQIIVSKANELLNEDNVGSVRSYQFEFKSNEDYYSIIVTVDINEGITCSRESFAWNFTKSDGQLLDIYEHCQDRYTLAKTIDGCIINTTSYDTIIHTWLTDILTSKFTSNNFSYYFDGEHFIAIINERFRLNSADRDPILIKVPYSQIKSLVTAP